MVKRDEDDRVVSGAPGPEASKDFETGVAPYRRELVLHCYRMLGSLADAEDVAQETLLRAWRGLDAFEQPASLRTWLHRIATHACIDAIERRRGEAHHTRSLPTALAPPARLDDAQGPPVAEPVWLEPIPDTFLGDGPPPPDATYSERESVAFAFLVTLQELPAKQRAAILLREVLGFTAVEVASLLDLTIPAANSALQRARGSLRQRVAEVKRPDESKVHEVLASYMRAWHEADVSLLVSLLQDECRLSMPPLPFWYQGRADIGASISSIVLGPEARGSIRMLAPATGANGWPALAAYQRARPGEPFLPMGLHVLRIEPAGIAEIITFLGHDLRGFGLPPTLPGGGSDDRP
jgi:RNA polymerase sigma-70 factor (ECF subfamily)